MDQQHPVTDLTIPVDLSTSTMFNFRISPELLARFKQATKKEDRSASAQLRHLMREFIEEAD